MHVCVAGILHWKLVTAYIDPNFQVIIKMKSAKQDRFHTSIIIDHIICKTLKFVV